MDSFKEIRALRGINILFEAGSKTSGAKETPQEIPQEISADMQSDTISFSDESNEVLIAANTTKSNSSKDAQKEKEEIIKEYINWFNNTKNQSKDKLVCDTTQRDILKDMDKHFGGLDSLENWNIGPVYARDQKGDSYGHYATGIFDKEGNLDSIMDPVPPRRSPFWVQDAPRIFSPSEWSEKWSSPVKGEKGVLPDNENPKRCNDKYYNDKSNDIEIFHR